MTDHKTPLKKKFLFLIFVMLVMSALACQAVLGTPPTQNGNSFQNITPDVMPESSTSENFIPSNPQKPPSSGTINIVPNPENNINGNTAFVEQDVLINIYEQANKGVVAIRTLTAQGDGLGSGFVIDTDGHIVTNYHVIENVEELEIDFSNGFKTHGEVIGTDLDSDLAVIKVDIPVEQLHPLSFGDSNQVKVGEFVAAIGNPFGLSSTMTVGIVSAKGRVLESLNPSPGGQPFSAGDIIQTDAAVNPGNSGGPLLNMKGEIIGVNRAIRTESFDQTGTPLNSGVSFAISANIVKRVTPVLIEKGKYDYPYLGVSSYPEVTLKIQEDNNLPQSTGALITTVVPGGPAETGGIEVGDLITAIDGREVIVFGDLLSYLITDKNPGDEIDLTIIRNQKTLTLTVVLGSRP